MKLVSKDLQKGDKGLKTKEKILEAALVLFNSQGTEQTTVRHIAAALGISHGNLCYHFSTREAIIEGLYERMALEFDAKMQALQSMDLTFAEMIKSAEFAVRLFYKNRFLMLDFVSIMRKNEKIRAHYVALMEQRKNQFKFIFAKAVDSNLMRAELYPAEFENLTVVFTILGDSWISHSEFHFEGTEEEKLTFYSKVMFSAIAPYLTAAGWAQMNIA